MDIRNRKALKAAASERLAAAPNQKQLVFLWIGASTLLSLIVSLLHFLLDSQIANTGGLDGIGLRSALTTVQELLSGASSLLVPFWTMGYYGVILRYARGQSADPRHMLDGFRRFGPVLRLILLRGLLCILLAVGVSYLGISILSATPLANPVYEYIMAHEEALLSGIISEADATAMLEAMTPMLIGCVVLSALVLIPVTYRLRLSNYALMDDPAAGAVAAMRKSNRLMRRRCFAFFRLELSFWWFYLAQFAGALLCYGDVFLPAMGIPLPMNSDVAFFLFYVLGLLVQLGVYCFRGNEVEAAYALFYQGVQAETVSLQTPPTVPEPKEDLE